MEMNEPKSEIREMRSVTVQSVIENGSLLYRKQCNVQPAAHKSAEKELNSTRASSSPKSSNSSAVVAEVTSDSGGQNAMVPTVLETRPSGFTDKSND